MRGLETIILTGSAIMATLGWNNENALNGSERDLFERLAGALASNSPSSSQIVQAFGLPPECARRSCFFEQSEVATSGFTSGNLRPAEDGLVFVLEGLRGDCIRIGSANRYFGPGEVRQSCFDSDCWSFTVRRRWGTLSFGLETPSATCASSVVINSLPYRRLRNDAGP